MKYKYTYKYKYKIKFNKESLSLNKRVVAQIRSVWISKIFFGLSSFLLIISNGCGDIKVLPLQEGSRVVEGKTTTTLPRPLIEKGQKRILFFVDQSHSMIREKCEGDLDGEGPVSANGATPNCSYKSGVDNEAHRWVVVEKLIEELSLELNGNEDDESTLVAIAPFSGGQYQRLPGSYTGERQEDFQFKTIKEAKKRLSLLKEEHVRDLDNVKNNRASVRMGTSVPLKTLNYMVNIFKNEIYKIKHNTPDELPTSQLEFVYISDGVYKPLNDYLTRSIEECTRLLSDHSYCNWIIPIRFKESFGNPEDNNTDTIANSIKGLTDYIKDSGARPLNLRLVALYPNKVPSKDFDDPRTKGIKNIFDAIFNKVSSAKKYILDSDKPPFHLVGSGGLSSYRLEEFHAINLNAFVSETGKFVTDSDGDGISDSEEIALGLNPQKYYTDDGSCNDLITQSYGCRSFKCEKDFDEDGDGLNECEESTFNSNNKIADTDEDNIIDIFEALRGLNPRLSDAYRSSGGSEISDRQMFFLGINPKWPFNKTPLEHQVRIHTQDMGTQMIQDEQGTYRSRAYQIYVENIPLAPTLKSKGARTMFRKLNDPSSKIPLEESLIPTDHEVGINQILFLAKITSETNPNDSSWFLKRMEIPFSHGNLSRISIDLKEFKPLTLKNPIR